MRTEGAQIVGYAEIVVNSIQRMFTKWEMQQMGWIVMRKYPLPTVEEWEKIYEKMERGRGWGNKLDNLKRVFGEFGYEADAWFDGVELKISIDGKVVEKPKRR